MPRHPIQIIKACILVPYSNLHRSLLQEASKEPKTLIIKGFKLHEAIEIYIET